MGKTANVLLGQHVLPLIALLLLSLAGCTSERRYAENSPYAKLADADVLIVLDRPATAERLISEALEQCAESSEPRCFANAYRMYGLLLMSPVLEEPNWQEYFTEKGFRDRSIRYEQRHHKAVEYFDRAAEQYARIGYYDAVTNVLFNKAVMLTSLGDKAGACMAYDDTAAAYAENQRLNPDIAVVVPEGYSDVHQFIDEQKRELGCAAGARPAAAR